MFQSYSRFEMKLSYGLLIVVKVFVSPPVSLKGNIHTLPSKSKLLQV